MRGRLPILVVAMKNSIIQDMIAHAKVSAEGNSSWRSAEEIAKSIGGKATARKVAAAMRQVDGFYPDWCDATEDTRMVGSSCHATHRVVRVYRISRQGLVEALLAS